MDRNQKKQETHDKVLNTAERLFREQGYAAVSTRMIAKEAGVAVGTVFSHFSDKAELTKSLFHQRLEKILVSAEPVEKESLTGVAFLLGQAQYLYAFYDQDRSFSLALLQHSVFDFNFFGPQMVEFVNTISFCLRKELPHFSDQKRQAIAKAMFSAYMFTIITGIGNENSKPEDWLKSLKQECENLLACCVEAK